MDKQFTIFDMDGTLIDSMVYWKDLASEYLLSKGINQIPEEILDQIKAMTIPQSAALFQKTFGISGDIEAEMDAMMDDHYRKDIPIKSGVLEYLEQLHRKGIRMCVASATAEHLMESCLTRLGIRDYFEFLLSCESVGAGKRSPLIYQKAAEKMNAIPENIAVYEDALYAVQTAKKAGFYVVGVYDDSAAEEWHTIGKIANEIILNWEEAI